MLTTTIVILALIVVAFVGFQKKLRPARIELLCQNTGKTFQVNVHKAQHAFTCRHCGRESWNVIMGEGKGNIAVTYVDGTGASRKLDKVHAEQEGRLVSVDATGGTFVIVEQE